MWRKWPKCPLFGKFVCVGRSYGKTGKKMQGLRDLYGFWGLWALPLWRKRMCAGRFRKPGMQDVCTKTGEEMSYFDLLAIFIVAIGVPFVALMMWLFGGDLCQK